MLGDPRSVLLEVVVADDAELVAIWVPEHDEVGVGRVWPAVDTLGPKLEQPRDLILLVIGVEVEMDRCGVYCFAVGQLQGDRNAVTGRVLKHMNCESNRSSRGS